MRMTFWASRIGEQLDQNNVFGRWIKLLKQKKHLKLGVNFNVLF
jgi:hypothetical protein